METQTPESFLAYLLYETEKVHESSYIKKRILSEKKGEEWYYSVCGTQIFRGRPILIGLNWGGKGKFVPQRLEDYNKLGQDIHEYKFIKGINQRLKYYMSIDALVNTNYTNLSFLRSPNIRWLDNDWEVTLPLLKEYINYINPPWILFASISKVYESKFKSIGAKISKEYFSFIQSNRHYSAYYGNIGNAALFTVPYPERNGGG